MEIVENRIDLLADFIRLNQQWISHYFELEQADIELAADPEKVIRQGGYVFSLLHEGQVAGVCALFNKGEDQFELARMAVDPAYQGRGYANLLMDAAMQKLQAIKAKRVYLVSNTKLNTAIVLYKKYGFVVESLGQHPHYARADITMSRQLS